MPADSATRFPVGLSPLHDGALRDAVDAIVVRFAPVGLVAAGSILRGEGGLTSDLDLYVIHLAPWRQRVQKRFRGVPAEIFVNPPASIRGYFAGEHRDGRPITAHMLATGFVVLDRDPVVETLRREAKTWLEKPRTTSQFAVDWARYLPACHFDDARDVAGSDPATASMIGAFAVRDALRFVFERDGKPLPRDKDLLRAVAALDPALADAARRALAATDVRDRMEAADEVARRALGVEGFFEWESPPDPVKDA